MRIPSIALLAALLLPLPALADSYTYTYTGNDFTSVSGSGYTLSDSITGEFTLSAPLADNTTDTTTPALFSFSDGVHTIGNSNSTLSDLSDDSLDVTTDASGDITSWNFYFFTQSSGAYLTSDANGNDYATEGGNEAYNLFDPGTWTVTGNPAETPEPPSFILLGTGLAGAFVLSRSRRAAHV